MVAMLVMVDMGMVDTADTVDMVAMGVDTAVADTVVETVHQHK